MTNTGVSSMNFQWLFDRPIAHRGLHDEQYPENSMPAYEQAIAHNFNIEIDVHVSKDGEVVVFHDDNRKRVCGVDKLVKDCTVKELKSYPLAKGVSLDMEAYCTNLADYKKKFPKYFAKPPVVISNKKTSFLSKISSFFKS